MSSPQQQIPQLTLALALTPIIFLISLLACSVYLFGADSSYGANQIALVLATCVAALEDSATLTSALIPWNTCGAYMSATLGVATISYAPFAFFNLLCPVIAIIYGFANIALKPAQTEAERALTGQT